MDRRTHRRASNKSLIDYLPSTRRMALILALGLIAVVIAACDSSSGGTSTSPTATTGATISAAPYSLCTEGKPPNLGAPVPDPKSEVTETKATGELPDFLSQVTGALHDKVAALYKGAVENPDAYSHIPCYCGCALYTHAHMSLEDCYIKDMHDGQVTFTDHSLTCDFCQETAQMTVDGLAKNQPLKDIRASVFKRFSYTGIWTDTPAVP